MIFPKKYMADMERRPRMVPKRALNCGRQVEEKNQQKSRMKGQRQKEN